MAIFNCYVSSPEGYSATWILLQRTLEMLVLTKIVPTPSDLFSSEHRKEAGRPCNPVMIVSPNCHETHFLRWFSHLTNICWMGWNHTRLHPEFQPCNEGPVGRGVDRKMPPRNGEMNIPIVVCSSASELILQDLFGVKIRIIMIMILNGWLATRIWPSLCNGSQSAPTGVSRRRLETAFRHGRGEWSARSSNWYTEICCSGYYIILRGFHPKPLFSQKKHYVYPEVSKNMTPKAN